MEQRVGASINNCFPGGRQACSLHLQDNPSLSLLKQGRQKANTGKLTQEDQPCSNDYVR